MNTANPHPQRLVKCGEKVVDVMFWTKLEKSGERWCVPGMQTAVTRMSNTVDASLVFRKILEENPLPKGCPQETPPLQNSKTTKPKQSDCQLKLLDQACSISTFDLDRINSEIEKRKSMDYEMDVEQEEWEQPENNEKETMDDPMCFAMSWGDKEND